MHCWTTLFMWYTLFSMLNMHFVHLVLPFVPLWTVLGVHLFLSVLACFSYMSNKLYWILFLLYWSLLLCRYLPLLDLHCITCITYITCIFHIGLTSWESSQRIPLKWLHNIVWTGPIFTQQNSNKLILGLIKTLEGNKENWHKKKAIQKIKIKTIHLMYPKMVPLKI